jgi:single-strand DNA-binding protein
MSFSKKIIVGNLGKDPEVVVTSTGKRLMKFSVGVQQKDSSGNNEAVWNNVTVFGDKLIDILAKLLTKGKQVYVEGQDKVTAYISKKDGTAKANIEILASDVRVLGGNSTAKTKAASVSGFSNSQNIDSDDVTEDD